MVCAVLGLMGVKTQCKPQRENVYFGDKCMSSLPGSRVRLLQILCSNISRISRCFCSNRTKKIIHQGPFLLTLVDLSGKVGRKGPGEGLPRSLMALSAFELVRLRICLRIPKGFNSHKDARPQKWAINDNLWSQDSLGSFGSEP